MRTIKQLHKKHIENLKMRIKELEKQNKILNDRNIFLKIKLKESTDMIDESARKILSIQKEYDESIKNVKELKDEYKKLIGDAMNERKIFKKESSAYLKKIKKDLGG